MITVFKVENFRSIVNLVFDLRYGEKRAPNGYQQMATRPFWEDEKTGARVVPCAALFGANAAGKSNVIKALVCLKRIVEVGEFEEGEFYNGNAIIPCGETTYFEIEFIKSGQRYVYGIRYGKEGVVSEQLLVNGRELFYLATGEASFRIKELGVENYPVEKLRDIIRVECCDVNGVQKRTLLNCLGSRYTGLNGNISEAYWYIVNEIDVIHQYAAQKTLPTAVKLLAKRENISNDQAVGRIVEVLRRLDLDIVDIKMTERPAVNLLEEADAFSYVPRKRRSPYMINSIHKNLNGDLVTFQFMRDESEGTQRLATIIGYMLAALSSGNTLWIDEFDWALHPILVREILRLFKDVRFNKKNAHLVFTTHMTDLLDDNMLRMSEVYFVQKNLRVGTKLKRLVDLRDDEGRLRNVTNFRKQYLDGLYNAIPHPVL